MHGVFYAAMLEPCSSTHKTIIQPFPLNDSAWTENKVVFSQMRLLAAYDDGAQKNRKGKLW